jgi:hypothetical protein
MSEQEPRKIGKVVLTSLLNRDWELDGCGEDEIYFKSKLLDGNMAQMKMYNFRDCADLTKRECSVVCRLGKEEYVFIPRVEVFAGIDYKGGVIRITATALNPNEHTL